VEVEVVRVVYSLEPGYLLRQTSLMVWLSVLVELLLKVGTASLPPIHLLVVDLVVRVIFSIMVPMVAMVAVVVVQLQLLLFHDLADHPF
jgi:hypothetical protein